MFQVISLSTFPVESWTTRSTPKPRSNDPQTWWHVDMPWMPRYASGHGGKDSSSKSCFFLWKMLRKIVVLLHQLVFVFTWLPSLPPGIFVPSYPPPLSQLEAVKWQNHRWNRGFSTHMACFSGGDHLAWSCQQKTGYHNLFGQYMFFSQTWFCGHYVKRKMIWQMGGELYKMLILIVFSSGWKLYDLPSWMKQNVGGLPNKSAINLQFTSSREAALAGNDMKHVHSNLYTVEFKFQSNLPWGNGISISIHGWWLMWLRAFTPLILSHFLWRQNKTGTWGAGCATIEKNTKLHF